MGLTWQQSVISHDHKFGIYFDILKGFFISFSGLFGVILCNACPAQCLKVVPSVPFEFQLLNI